MAQFTGMVSGKVFADKNWNTRFTRRKIFADYPTGTFTLTGLLSMMEPDWTDNAEFGWQEKVWADTFTKLIANGVTSVPFTTTGGTVSPGSTVTLTAGTTYRVYLGSVAGLRINNTLRITNLPTSSSRVEVYGIVQSVGANFVELSILTTVAGVINTSNAFDGGTAGPVNAPVSVLGNANAEGGSSTGSGSFTPPFTITNYTQIFRDPFSITNTAAQQPTDFDAQGTFRNQAQEACLTHMTGLEKAFLWGEKSIRYVIDDGEEVPLRTTGGLIWFLKEYEKADSLYRGGSGAPALTSNTDIDKRIIDAGTSGELSWSFFTTQLMERLFMCTSNKGFEKIALCGSGFICAVQAYLEANTQCNRNFTTEEVYGLKVTRFDTAFGTVRLATHPLFTKNPQWRNDVLIIDINLLKYRPLRTRDTKRYSGRQGTSQDRQKQEWLTEAGLELRWPQSCMWLKNVKAFT